MKFTLFAVAAVVVISTTNAQLARCDVTALMPIANGDQASQCAEDSGFSLMMAAVTENPPKPEQYAAICKSDMCQGVLQKLYEIVPTDCALRSGGSLKALTEPVVSSCKASASAPVSGPVPVPVPAPVAAPVPAFEELSQGTDQGTDQNSIPTPVNTSPTQHQQKQC